VLLLFLEIGDELQKMIVFFENGEMIKDVLLFLENGYKLNVFVIYSQFVACFPYFYTSQLLFL